MRTLTPHTVETIACALDYLKGTQVDCLCWCVGEQITYSWPLRVLENIYDLKAEGASLAPGWESDRDVMQRPHNRTVDVKLRGIDPNASYVEASGRSCNKRKKIKGSQLIEGLQITLESSRSSDLLVYRKILTEHSF